MSNKNLQGALLLDGGKLQGSFFQHSVILICHHDAEGAFGLILNRPAGSVVGDAIVADIPDRIRKLPLYVGGPVQTNSLSFLYSDAFLPDANVIPNLSVGHTLDELIDLGESFSPTQKLKLFAGYAGWGPGQLEGELKRQDWLVHRPVLLDMVFSTEPKLLWKKILSSMDPMHKLVAESPEDLSWN